MSIAAEHDGRGYAPLSQSMSNTDTENEDEEIEESSRQPMRDDSIMIQENGRFYPLDETKGLANRLRNGRNINLGYRHDDVPLTMGHHDADVDVWKRPHMSFLRQLLLVVSVLLCLVTILIFLYILPCNDSDPLTNRPALLWDNTLRGIELHGPIVAVPGTPRNLIIMFRGQLYGELGHGAQGPKFPPEGGGVISMHGGNGSPLWWVPLPHLPTGIDCKNLDADGSGNPDCLIAGEHGLLVCIEPIAGTVRWSSSVRTHSELPIFLPDINGDGIDDLLSVELAEESTAGLALLSGRDGHLLGHHLSSDCRRILISSLDSTGRVSYLCHVSSGEQSAQSVYLKELFDGMNNPQAEKKLAEKLNGSPNPYVVAKSDSNSRVWELTRYHRLVIEHQGTCPGDLCQTTMDISFEGPSNESRSIWSTCGPNSYGMEPAILTQLDRPLVTGFVIKFWQWDQPDSAFEKINSSVVARTITERTLVVIINQTEVHAVNASQTEIGQICRGLDCQPSLKLQSQSLAVADLNNDGSRELISYQTSYEFSGDVQSLKSKVEFVMLDAEVAKLTQIIIT